MLEAAMLLSTLPGTPFKWPIGVQTQESNWASSFKKDRKGAMGTGIVSPEQQPKAMASWRP